MTNKCLENRKACTNEEILHDAIVWKSDADIGSNFKSIL